MIRSKLESSNVKKQFFSRLHKNNACAKQRNQTSDRNVQFTK